MIKHVSAVPVSTLPCVTVSLPSSGIIMGVIMRFTATSAVTDGLHKNPNVRTERNSCTARQWKWKRRTRETVSVYEGIIEEKRIKRDRAPLEPPLSNPVNCIVIECRTQPL